MPCLISRTECGMLILHPSFFNYFPPSWFMKEKLLISSLLHVTAPQFSMPTKIMSHSFLVVLETCYLSHYFSSYWGDF